jgi:hypothetical protein
MLGPHDSPVTRCPVRSAATAAITCDAAASGSSCSHTRSTVHPANSSFTFVSASRARLPWSFADHHSAFCFGAGLCTRQPCQKQPSTKIARRRRGNMTSARRRSVGSGAASTRYRSPARWSRRRRASSAGVSRVGVFTIRLRAVALEALGVTAIVGSYDSSDCAPYTSSSPRVISAAGTSR